jgi:hypothetical protein
LRGFSPLFRPWDSLFNLRTSRNWREGSISTRRREPPPTLKPDDDAEALKLLIRAGCDLNQRANDDGATPAFAAACEGQTAALALLVSAGCDLNKADKDRLTPAHVVLIDDGFAQAENIFWQQIAGSAEIGLSAHRREVAYPPAAPAENPGAQPRRSTVPRKISR